MITTKNLNLTLKHATILKNVSVSLHRGKITTFIGKSGAGKTSLLKCIANLYLNYQGDILYKGQSLKGFTTQQRAQAIGFVFQQYNLFPHFTALQNCVHPQVVALKVPLKQAEEKAAVLLDLLGLSTCKFAYPNQLSGGQQQRVAIARALVLEPQVLLFDEPSSALDPQATKALAQLLKDLSATGITIGLCSHDVAFVKQLLEHVYLLDDGVVLDEYHSANNACSLAPSIKHFLEG